MIHAVAEAKKQTFLSNYGKASFRKQPEAVSCGEINSRPARNHLT
jgi:hypothetical protein